MEGNEGQLPKAIVIYCETHYDLKNKKKRIISEAKKNYVCISLYAYHICKTSFITK